MYAWVRKGDLEEMKRCSPLLPIASIEIRFDEHNKNRCRKM